MQSIIKSMMQQMKQLNTIKLLFVTGAIVLCQAAHAQLTNFGNLYIHTGANVSVSGSVTNNGAATDLLNNGKLQLTGDFTNNGNDLNAAGTGKITFNGTQKQSINGTQATSFYDITQLNPDSLVIFSNQLVRNELMLTAGSFFLNDNTLTINGAVGLGSGNFSSTEKSGLILNGSNTKNIYFNPANNRIKTLTVNATATNVILLDSLFIAGSTLGELTVNGTLNTNGYLTLTSEPAGTSRVAPSTGTVNGKVNVERYFPAQRSWRLLTSPLTNTTSIYSAWQNNGVYEPGKDMLVTGPSPSVANGLDASYQNNFSMKWWDINTQALVGVGNTKDSMLSNNRSISADNNGYFVFVRGDRDPSNTNLSNVNATTLSSTGNLQIGRQVFSASGNAGKYTLIGNPYASPVDFNQLSRQNLVKRFYVWDPNLNEVGGYVMLDDLDGNNVYTKTLSASTQDNNIQSSQAFFVETIATAPASLTFNEVNKSAANNSSMFRPAGNENGIIRTSLYIMNADGSEKLADEALAEFDDVYNSGINNEDGLKFGNVNENLSIVRNGIPLCAERRPLAKENDTVFFKLTKTRQFTYRLHIQSSSISNETLQAYLEDSYTATQTPISLGISLDYNFAVTGDVLSSASGRFRIIFKKITVLPVTFVEIKGTRINSSNHIAWKVENESNISFYTIERSANGRTFENIGQTAVGNNPTYTWDDNNAISGNCFYRVHSTGTNGEKIYSSIIKIADNIVPAVSVFPNPVTNNQFTIQNIPAGKQSITVLSSNGQIVYSKEINNPLNSNEKILMVNKAAPGAYEVIIRSGENETIRIPIIVL
jgi:hypothetical protein